METKTFINNFFSASSHLFITPEMMLPSLYQDVFLSFIKDKNSKKIPLNASNSIYQQFFSLEDSIKEDFEKKLGIKFFKENDKFYMIDLKEKESFFHQYTIERAKFFCKNFILTLEHEKFIEDSLEIIRKMGGKGFFDLSFYLPLNEEKILNFQEILFLNSYANNYISDNLGIKILSKESKKDYLIFKIKESGELIDHLSLMLEDLCLSTRKFLEEKKGIMIPNTFNSQHYPLEIKRNLKVLHNLSMSLENTIRKIFFGYKVIEIGPQIYSIE